MPEKDRNSSMAFIKSYYRIIHFAFFSIDAPKYGEKDIHQVASTTYKSKVYVNNYLKKHILEKYQNLNYLYHSIIARIWNRLLMVTKLICH